MGDSYREELKRNAKRRQVEPSATRYTTGSIAREARRQAIKRQQGSKTFRYWTQEGASQLRFLDA